MKNIKKFISLFTVAAILSSSTATLSAANYNYYEGEGYSCARTAPRVSTETLFVGAVVVAGIVTAVVLSNDHHHHHSHAH